MVEPIVESSAEIVPNVAKAETIRVLHVDDDQICLKVAKQCLETHGEFEVDTASSVNEALEKLKKTDYDVVVSDYQMPDKDGLEFLKELRKKGNTVPFIIFTGKGREEIAVKALNLGASGYFTRQGQPETVYGELAHGIRQATERKKTETKIWERDERLRAVLSLSPDAIAVSDLHGNILDCNEAAWKMLGFSSKEELIGKSSLDFIAQKDRQKAYETLKKSLEQGTTRNLEFTLLNKDGEASWGELSASTMKDSAGNPLGLVSVMRDITERKKTEKMLQESEERFMAIFEGANDGILVADVKTKRFSFANSRICEISGYSLEELLKLGVGDIHPEKDLAYVMESFAKLVQGKLSLAKDIPVLRKDGRVVYCDVSAKSVKIGSQECLVGLFRDVTERKKADEKLQESEERFRAIFEGANDGILVADVKTKRFSFANSRICEISGYSLEELLKLSVGDINPKKDLPYVNDSFENQRQGKVALSKDIPVLRKDGRVVYCDVSSKPMKIGSQEYLVGIFRDVTESKKAEEKLKESEEKYQTTFESSMDALMLLDERGFFDCNTSTLRLFGCKTVEDFAKYHPADLSPPTQPDGSTSMEAAMNHIKRAFKTGADSFFWIHKRTDGTTFPADVLLTRMSLKGRNVLQATVRDATERKEAEEKLKENSKRIELMNEKLRVVGGLSRHDVNNKLSAVTGYAYLLKKKHADQADIVEGLGMMEQAVKGVGKIFDFARIYEKLGVEELTYVGVEKTLDEAVTLFSGLTIKVVNGCHGLTVLADSFLRQLFYNFIDNTRKYGGKTTTASVYYEKAESGELRLVYEDDGVGISAENKLKLFTEGFSTGGSTGFGLFLIRKMIDVYGWQIKETGELGKGAKFVITIPKANLNGKENYQLS